MSGGPAAGTAPRPATEPARRGFVLQVDLSDVAEDDLDDLLRTVQNLADLATEWFPHARPAPRSPVARDHRARHGIPHRTPLRRAHLG